MARSLESKVDEILEQLRLLALVPKQLEDLNTSVSQMKEEIKSVKFDVDQHEDRVTTLEKEVLNLKITDNNHKQQLRALTLRILNLPQVPAEKDDLCGCVYEFIKPVLVAAKAAKDLSSLPQASSVIESVFRPYQGEHGRPPPPVILKVPNRHIKLALLKNRKHLPQPGSAVGGTARAFIVEDLTPDNHRVLNLLNKSKKVEKSWSVDGQIKYILAGQSQVKTVKSVFGSLEEILNE